MMTKKSLLVLLAGIIMTAGIAVLIQPASAQDPIPMRWQVKCKGNWQVTLQWTKDDLPHPTVPPIVKTCSKKGKIDMIVGQPPDANDLEISGVLDANPKGLSAECYFDKDFEPGDLKKFRFICLVGDPLFMKGNLRPAPSED